LTIANSLWFVELPSRQALAFDGRGTNGTYIPAIGAKLPMRIHLGSIDGLSFSMLRFNMINFSEDFEHGAAIMGGEPK
jgi:hypothetical protein